MQQKIDKLSKHMRYFGDHAGMKRHSYMIQISRQVMLDTRQNHVYSATPLSETWKPVCMYMVAS